ncbi:hypothetical protein ENSA5_34280 [Enhygromyxa salina]|uniref:Uncharacterized protein n=1 Tax=Enhygromyxa salina TaxID=215803 RepID=A0A2S9XX44_9BACT|nr:hypothetical protein [Enhygromyxa salina]PRP97436.1 hypothetical protein ENSA5_34280 [Enhygromyxa salina]
MTHRSMHSKFLASSLASLLAVPALFAGAITLLSPDVARAAVNEAACRIHAVEASQKGDGTIPAELNFLADQLQAPEFARYKGFRLLDAKDFKLKLGEVVDQKFKSGHNVKLTLLGGGKDKLELHTKLERGGSSLVDMDFMVGSNQIMLIPVRRGDQAIIFAYQCKG